MNKTITIIILTILTIILLYEIISLIVDCIKERKAKKEHDKVMQKVKTLEMLGIPAYSLLFFYDNEEDI